MSVRGRILVAVIVTAALASAAFALLSIGVIHATLRSTVDMRLRTTAAAIAAATDVYGGRPHPDADDLSQSSMLLHDVHASIVDRSGAVLQGQRPPVGPVDAGGARMTDARSGGEDVRVAVVPIVRDGRNAGSVIAWLSLEWIEAADRIVLAVSVILGLCVTGLGVLFAWLTTDRIVAPLDRIARLAERIESKDLSQRLNASGNDELARLASSFDRMLDRLQAAFEMERRFAADASHELRAPLTVLRAETELALRQPRSVAEYRKALQSLQSEIERLEMLTNDMLIAARAEIDAAQGRTVDAGEVAQSIVARVASSASLKGVGITGDAKAALVVADPSGLERALLAIVHNAIGFAAHRVHVGLEASEDSVAISVRDDGCGFSPTALENATERFWRADDSRPRGGTGLGLAIARTIIEANGGKLSIANATEGGALVTISLHRPAE